MGTDIDINTRFRGLKIWILSQMCLLVLAFHRMISRTAIDILTINANAHSQTLNYARVKQYLPQFYRLFFTVAKQRLDKLLVERELCVSRQLAQRFLEVVKS
jgi:hypothetical protein